MKTSNVGLSNLLDQLSEEKISLVVGDIAVNAGCDTGSGSSDSSSGKSNNADSKSNNKDSKSNNRG